jgi:hypothetical protein
MQRRAAADDWLVSARLTDAVIRAHLHAAHDQSISAWYGSRTSL